MPNQRLTIADAEAILLAEGTAAQIAERFDVSHQTVRLYKHLATGMAREAAENLRALGQDIVPLPGSASHRFTESDVAEIRSSKASSGDEAEKWGCSASMIRMIRTGGAYR